MQTAEEEEEEAITITPKWETMLSPALEDWTMTRSPAVRDSTNENSGPFTGPSPDSGVTTHGRPPSANTTTQRCVSYPQHNTMRHILRLFDITNSSKGKTTKWNEVHELIFVPH
jgi:hypothetical protein